MLKIKSLLWRSILLLLIYSSGFSQIPDHLKKNYRDLLTLNNSKQYQTAILHGKIMVAQQPKFSYGYEQLAKTFEKAGSIEQGIAYFDSLCQQKPDNPYAYYAIGLLEKGRANYDQAIGNLKVCIKLNHQFVNAYFQLAEAHHKLNNLKTASEYFNSMLQEDSLNAAAYYGLGCIYNLERQWQEGEKAFAKALQLNPELTHAYYLKGLMSVNQRKHQEALQVWREGAEIAKKQNDIELEGMLIGNVGTAYYDLGEWQQGIVYLEQALTMARELKDKVKEVKHLNSMAACYRLANQPNKALKLFQKAMKIAQNIGDHEWEERLWSNMSTSYGDLSNYQKSVECGKKALKMAEIRGDSSAVATHCWNIGGAYGPMAKYDLALSYLERAFRIKDKEGDKRALVGILNNIGMVYKEKGDLQNAIKTFNQIVDISREIHHKPSEALALGNLGYAYSGLAEYSRAKDYFQQALSIAEELKSNGFIALQLGNLGLIYKKWGDLNQALAKIQKAQEIYEQIPSPRDQARQLVNLADIHKIRGDYLQALELEKQALAISRKIGTQNYTAIILGNIGVTYDKLGDYDEALSYFEQGRKLTRQISAPGAEPQALINIGSIYEKKNDLDKAFKYYAKALLLSRQIGDKGAQAAAMTAMGNIQRQKKEYTKALENYNQAIALAKDIGVKLEEGSLYLNIARLSYEQGEYAAALPNLERASRIARTINAFELQYETFGAKAETYTKLNQFEQAIGCYEQAVQEIDSVRARLPIEKYKTSFMEDKFSIYESLITLLIRLGRYEEAYKYLQHYRARSLLEILSPEKIDLTKGISPDLFQKYRSSEFRLREIYERLGQAYKTTEADSDSLALKALADTLNQVKRNHEKILDEIRLNHPGWAQATGNVPPPELNVIQKNILSPEMTLVEYFVGAELIAVWVIKQDYFACEVLEIKRDDLKQAVQELRRPFQALKQGDIKNFFDIKYDVKLANQLYEKIFHPIERHLAKNSSLIIVPDGILFYLPFEALIVKIEDKARNGDVQFSRYKNAHYLIENYAMSYVPAVGILGLQQKSAEAQKPNSLIIGRPDFGPYKQISPDQFNKFTTNVVVTYKNSHGLGFKPLGGQDALDVSEIIKPARLLLDKEATEENFKNEASNCNNIYISTHAIVDENQPLYSIIVFAYDKESKEDGFLHPYEVFNLNLNTDLVTLGACETGLGKLRRGEGIIGFTRAFLYAGASSVVVSLWSVEESAAELMKYFYHNLKQGMSKSEALRQAKLKLIQSEGKIGGKRKYSFAHPFLWAPFILVGQGN